MIARKIIVVIFLFVIISDSCFTQYMRLSTPISRGNIWVYIADSDFDKVTVTDSIFVIDSVEYSFITFIPWRGIFWGDGMPVRLKWNDDLVVRLDSTYPDINHEFIYYKKNCIIGDTWTHRNARASDRQITYQVVDTIQANIFNTVTTVKTIFVTDGLIIDYEFWSEKFGFLQNSAPFGGTDHILKGCIIDGVLYGDTTTITDVGEEIFDLFLGEVNLSQNYPNPFNSSTVIHYAVKDAGLVKLKVYDILGIEVKELVNETKNVGNHSVEFNASYLPSGVYIYILHANGFRDSKKMLLLK